MLNSRNSKLNRFRENNSVFFMLLGLLFGCLVMSLSLNVFLIPANIAAGGVSGFALVVNKVTGIQIPLTVFVVSVSLALLALKIMGFRKTLRTVFGATVFSILIKLTAPVAQMHLVKEPVLACVTGGIMLGASIGIMFRANASTGGTDLLALVMSKVIKGVKPTQIMICIDGMIVISAGIVNHSLETLLYSGFAIVIAVKVADIVIAGFNYSKAVIIITDKTSDLGDAILNDLDRSFTVLKAEGGYTKTARQVLLVVVSSKEIYALKNFIMINDPSAFIIITDAQEVLGDGFKLLKDTLE